MAAITRILAFAALLLLTLGGCSRENQKWVGTWRGERKGMVMPDLDDGIASTLKKIEIKISPDGRYEMIEAGVPTRGEVNFGRDKVFLKVMSRFDRALDVETPDLTLEWQPDGSVQYTDPAAGYPQPADLYKVQETSPPPQP